MWISRLKEVWKPILRERLNLSHERKNLHYRYAIAAYNRLSGRLVLTNYKEPDLNGHFDDCTKDVLKELYVQEEMSDSDEESAEVEDK